MRNSGLTTDRQTDRQTDGQSTSASVELRFAAKNVTWMAREELSLDFFHQSHWCETPLMKTSAAQGNLGAVLRRNSYCKWWSQNFSETILFWNSDNKIKWLPFLDHRWMLLWAHSPLHRWECWFPPEAWHSKHSAAFWVIEICTWLDTRQVRQNDQMSL